MTVMKAKQAPLIDLLKAIPEDARLIIQHDTFSSSSHPVGRLCHEAAAALSAACPCCGATAAPAPQYPTDEENLL